MNLVLILMVILFTVAYFMSTNQTAEKLTYYLTIITASILTTQDGVYGVFFFVIPLVISEIAEWRNKNISNKMWEIGIDVFVFVIALTYYFTTQDSSIIESNVIDYWD